MRILSILISLVLSFSIHASEANKTANAYINALTANKFEVAAKYIAPADLESMERSVRRVFELNDAMIIEVLGFGQYKQKELNRLNHFQIFAALANYNLTKLNKSFGQLNNLKLLGVIDESDRSAHAVVRDVSNNSNHSSTLYLVVEDNRWYVKMPVPLVGLADLFMLHAESEE